MNVAATERASDGGPDDWAERRVAERTWRQRHGDTAMVWVGRLALLVSVLALWQLASGRWVDPLFISSPTAVAERFTQWLQDGTLISNTLVTLQEILVGYGLGATGGAVAGFVLGPLHVFYRVLDPFITALYSIPKVALAPLFIVWFGIGVEMKVLLAAVTVFFLVFLNTVAGVREVDRGLIDAVRLMGGNRREIMFKVTVPASLTGLITGLRVAIPYALIGAVIGELVASNRGLGYLISNSAATFDTAGVFAALVVLSVIAAALNLVVDLLSRRSMKWKPLPGAQ